MKALVNHLILAIPGVFGNNGEALRNKYRNKFKQCKCQLHELSTQSVCNSLKYLLSFEMTQSRFYLRLFKQYVKTHSERNIDVISKRYIFRQIEQT